ncbi:MAG: hypothetical protein HPY45_04750 [Anaerolineae bacterium]|nr:hypothetical protein [Anaerolineae bacterium]
MKRIMIFLAGMAVIILLLTRCGVMRISFGAVEETQPPTAAALLSSETPLPTYTPSPTSTPLPTETPLPTSTPQPTITPTPEIQFAFAVASDIHKFAGAGEYDTPQYFRGTLEKIASLGAGAFMVSPGDSDAMGGVRWSIDQYIGADYPWFPVIGNHEALDPDKMEWIRAFNPDTNGIEPPNIVRYGPPSCPQTNYAFDYLNAHFVVLNLYCDKNGDNTLDGDVSDTVYNWLVDDLNATDKKLIFVFGHEPLEPQPDSDNGRIRHADDSLNKYPQNRDRLWKLLLDAHVVAYIHGHTHNFSVTNLGGVWQFDAGHGRRMGDPGARSTFTLFHIHGDTVVYETYRDDGKAGEYTLYKAGSLTP